MNRWSSFVLGSLVVSTIVLGAGSARAEGKHRDATSECTGALRVANGGPEFVIDSEGRVTRQSDPTGPGTVRFDVPDGEYGIEVRMGFKGADDGVDHSYCVKLRSGVVYALDALPRGSYAVRLTAYVDPKNREVDKPQPLSGDAWGKQDAAAVADETAAIYANAANFDDLGDLGSSAVGAVTHAVRKVPLVEIIDAQRLYPVAVPGLRKLRADRQALQDLARQYDETKKQDPKQAPRVEAELRRAWRAFRANGAIPPLDQDAAGHPSSAYCKRALQYNLRANPELAASWLFGVFELPLTDASHTIELHSGHKVVGTRNLVDDRPVTAWATDVDHNAHATFDWSAGPDTEASLAQVVIAFASTVFKGMNLKAVSPLALTPNLPLTTSDACTASTKSVPNPLQPLAKFTARVESSASAPSAPGGHLQRGHDYVVSLCNGKCDAPTSQATVSPLRGYGVGLFGAITYDACVIGTPCDKGAFGTYEWDPTTASGPTERVARLNHVSSFASGFTTSLQLALLLPELHGAGGRFALGVGPSVLDMTGKNKFQTWTLNVFWAPHSLERSWTYFTLGTGFRIDQRPVVGNVGDTVVLSSTTGQIASLPGIDYERTYDWVVTAGIAFNLAGAFGDGAQTLFGTKGVAAPASNSSSGGK